MLTEKEATTLGMAIATLVAERGLGAISKKDYELLVFHHLSNARSHVDRDNYSLANHFKVTETKVKSLRLEASLRHQPANHKAVLKRVAQRVLDQARATDFKDGNIVITLENPVEKREFEYAAKQVNHRVDYGLNRENLEISLSALFEVVLSNLERPDESLREMIQKGIQDQKQQKALLASSKTLRQRTEELVKSATTKSALISIGGLLLGRL